jgi:diacylglycerol O-acyltransferase
MQRLTGLDAGFLYMEAPSLHMHTLKVAVLDPAPGVDELPIEWVRGQIETRLHLLPPFRRRLMTVPFGFHHPVWVDDPDFDITYHVRRHRIAAPGGVAEMDDAIGEIASRPLDRARPLWELYVLEGRADGRIAVLVKIHHAAADGVAASQLLANVMGTDATAPEPDGEPFVPEPLPSRARLLSDAFFEHLTQLALLPLLLARTLVRLSSVVRHRRGADVSPPRPILDTPRTSFNAGLTSRRAFASGSLPLDEVKSVKAALGVTLNDVVLGVVAGSLRQYLARRGELPDRPLVAGVPVSTDKPDAVARLGGNKVSNLFTTLATDEPDPLVRLRAIHAVTSEAKVVQNLLGAEMMQDWVQYTPPGPYSWFMRLYSRFNVADRHHPPLNVVVSNVPGPREPLYAGGARLAELYSVGPVLEGIGLNITVWSYLDRLYVGVLACRDATPDVASIVNGLGDALDELLALVPDSTFTAR